MSVRLIPAVPIGKRRAVRPAPITIRGRTLAVHRRGSLSRPVVVELVRGEVRQRWEVETYLEAAALQATLAAIYQGRRG